MEMDVAKSPHGIHNRPSDLGNMQPEMNPRGQGYPKDNVVSPHNVVKTEFISKILNWE